MGESEAEVVNVEELSSGTKELLNTEGQEKVSEQKEGTSTEQSEQEEGEEPEVDIKIDSEAESEVKVETREVMDGESLFDEGLIYGIDEVRKRPNMAFDEGLIYGADIFKDTEEAPPEGDYDSGLITDDAEERFRATNMNNGTTVQKSIGKTKRKKGSVKFKKTVIVFSDDDDDDSGLMTDEAEENYRVVYADKEVQTEEVPAPNEASVSVDEEVKIDPSTDHGVDEKNKTVTEVVDITDDENTDQPAKIRTIVKDDSDTSTSTASRVSTPTPTPRSRLMITKKVSQQVSESEYENTTADEKPVMLIRKKVVESALKKLDRTTVVEKFPMKRSTVSLANKRDKSADEASDSYDADYESYDNDEDYRDPYEPSEISLTDTIICMGFGYALVYS